MKTYDVILVTASQYFNCRSKKWGITNVRKVDWRNVLAEDEFEAKRLVQMTLSKHEWVIRISAREVDYNDDYQIGTHWNWKKEEVDYSKGMQIDNI